MYDDFYQSEEVLMRVEHHVLQAGQGRHSQQGGSLHIKLGGAL